MKTITQPMTLKKSQVKQIPISKLKVPDLLISEENAIVGYFDILGYSFKTDWKDSKHSVLDFSGALLLVAKEYPHLKINVFSDNAFVYTKIENVKDFFAGIRFAFDIWVQNGVLVRGGVAFGSYNEMDSGRYSDCVPNFVESIFFGSAVCVAVRNEDRKGPFLFVDKASATTINKFINEPVFQVESEVYCYAWSDNPHVLMRYIIMSFVRLLLALRKDKNAVAEKMRCGIMAALKWNSSKSDEPFYTLLLLLDSSLLQNVTERDKVARYLRFDDHYQNDIEFARSLKLDVEKTFGVDIAVAMNDSGLK